MILRLRKLAWSLGTIIISYILVCWYLFTITQTSRLTWEATMVLRKRTNAIGTKNISDSCIKFLQFKAPSWTLHYMKPLEEISVTCKKYLNAFKQKLGRRVKRITYHDNSTKSVGCTAESEMCLEHAHYDYILQTRINTPPCCIEKILTIYERLSAELRKYDIKHCMVYGGVIGYVRNKRMTPYDRDLDMMIEERYWRSERLENILKSLEQNYGHVADRIFEDTQMHICYSKTNKNCIDLWPYTITVDFGRYKISINHYEHIEQKYDTMIPFKLDDFNGFKTYFPRDAVDYVRMQYGLNAIKQELSCKMLIDNWKCVNETGTQQQDVH